MCSHLNRPIETILMSTHIRIEVVSTKRVCWLACSLHKTEQFSLLAEVTGKIIIFVNFQCRGVLQFGIQ